MIERTGLREQVTGKVETVGISTSYFPEKRIAVTSPLQLEHMKSDA